MVNSIHTLFKLSFINSTQFIRYLCHKALYVHTKTCLLYSYHIVLPVLVGVLHQEEILRLMLFMIKMYIVILPKLSQFLIKSQLLELSMLCLLRLQTMPIRDSCLVRSMMTLVLQRKITKE